MLAELTDHIMDIAMNSVRAGSKNISIAVIARKERNLLTITISDDGMGMTEDIARAAADPFFSTKDARKVGSAFPSCRGRPRCVAGSFPWRARRARARPYAPLLPSTTRTCPHGEYEGDDPAALREQP